MHVQEEKPLTEDWTFAHLKRAETLWGPHGYHRYPAKFIPQLVHRIIESYSLPGELVGDPFLGSATTGIEALRLGRRFWGSDISQVALLISRAKCTPLCPHNLNEVWQQLDSQLNEVPRVGRRHLTAAEKETITSIDIACASKEERFTYWFPDQYRESLAAILQLILVHPEETIRTFFYRTLSQTSSSERTGSTMADAALAELALLGVGKIAQSVNREVRALRYYFQDMYTALHELARVTVPGKRLILIVGNSYRRGVTIPTSEALCEMPSSMGLELERRIVRKIPVRVLVSTRDKKTGRFSSTTQSDTQVYPEEHVLIFRRWA